MNEQQSRAVAEALGGEAWQSGGDTWLVLKRRADGAIVAVSDEVVCEYADETALDESSPTESILLV